MLDWIFGRELNDVLNETKRIKISGIRFTIRKVDMLNYIEGTQVMTLAYDIHKHGDAKAEIPSVSSQKIRKHMIDIFLAGVVQPRLVRTKEEADAGNGFLADGLFINRDMCNELYDAIMLFTYGKKKVRSAMLAVKSS